LFLIFGAKAQIISCNASFTASISGLNVAFTPAYTGDSATTNHSWYFGDGSYSNIPVVNHTYATGGVYTITHRLIRHNPNGVVLCSD
jgi:PKD repeat protein